jgi:hypothetical protein
MFADDLEDTARIDHRRGATREAAMLAEWAFGTNLKGAPVQLAHLETNASECA